MQDTPYTHNDLVVGRIALGPSRKGYSGEESTDWSRIRLKAFALDTRKEKKRPKKKESERS